MAVTSTEIRGILARIRALLAQAMPSEDLAHRLLGAEQALTLMLGEKSFIPDWLDREEESLRQFHAHTRQHCSCAVCRVAVVETPKPQPAPQEPDPEYLELERLNKMSPTDMSTKELRLALKPRGPAYRSQLKREEMIRILLEVRAGVR